MAGSGQGNVEGGKRPDLDEIVADDFTSIGDLKDRQYSKQYIYMIYLFFRECQGREKREGRGRGTERAKINSQLDHFAALQNSTDNCCQINNK